MMKKTLSAVVFVCVLTACSQTPQTTQIVEKRDMYGCSVSAGEYFSYDKQKCVSRSEEHYKKMGSLRKKNMVHHQ
ncbi:hypothetical protein E5343_10520 [Rodentibacter caecimuris]|uniref:hypothetical protein n=1 Tax=Rodentibacter caecimuris TaxID=1796644 RepID=UPI0010941A65|nr:hypothetical protein [Pasteurella caecimuris]MCR1837692.1 hypothetical protein [Pasteurella caecimuris]MCU0106624.1 hypothetical protein [Pasteurella caecimuris]TGY48174.1 hypothetical protein E5343_10520 [Pasteurella caecimuris]